MRPINLEHLPQGEQIREKILSELSKNPLLRDENIGVDSEGIEVILEGAVHTYDQKWLAEDIVANVMGVVQIKNKIEVNYH